MSARAAWRLESLGFSEVYRYTPGKADWLANGLPTEGTRAEIPRVGGRARRDIPTCDLKERVGNIRERVRASGWDVCIVVNEQKIVLGRLREDDLNADAATPVEQVMEEGPTTYRLDRPAEETAKYLAERNIANVLITTSDGELIGLFSRNDAEVPGGSEREDEGREQAGMEGHID
jgi:CBS domain-containing protein